jgi:hypothetical protein
MCGASDNVEAWTERRLRVVVTLTDPAYTDLFESKSTLEEALGHDFDDVSVEELGAVEFPEDEPEVRTEETDPFTGIRHFLGMES